MTKDTALRVDNAAWFACGLGLVVAAVLLVAARNIAPPIFDPVGSAALPRACAVALIGTSIGILIEAALRTRRGLTPPVAGRIRPGTVGTFALMTAYLAAMQLGLGFTLSTILFTALAIPLVSHSLRSIPLAIGTALLMGFGGNWVFTSVFFVDLPGFG
uniref:tripartite tricarboxylate transporter TctB family protein n=1 Tax=Pararhizobium sp. IMCC3301 TaxID=3067904 RepID=UPI0027413E37|nr:tripartite tricarboxylate transporter TctB family protein [Pararhizobium sp. IMCC3301]